MNERILLLSVLNEKRKFVDLVYCNFELKFPRLDIQKRTGEDC